MSEGNASFYTDTAHVIIIELFSLLDVVKSTIQIKYILIFSKLKIEVLRYVTLRVTLTTFILWKNRSISIFRVNQFKNVQIGTRSFETSVTVRKSTRRNISEDFNL